MSKSSPDFHALAQQAKLKVPLSEVVRRYADISETTPSGDWLGCCPFHSERTPSFRVHDEGQHPGTFKCFGCGKSGDHITILQELGDFRHFRDAVSELCNIAGIPIPSPNGARPEPSPKPAAEGWGQEPLQNEFASHYGLTLDQFKDAGVEFQREDASWFTKGKKPRFPAYPKPTIPVASYPVFDATGKTPGGHKIKTIPRLDGKRQQWYRPSGIEAPIIGAEDLAKCDGRPLVLAGGEEKMIAARAAGFASICIGEQCPKAPVTEAIKRASPSRVIIAFDADEHADKHATRAVKSLEMHGISACIASWDNSRPRGYDLNDLLRDHGIDALRNHLNAATPVKPRVSTTPSEWDKPPVKMQDGKNVLPALDIDALPSWLANFAEFVAHETQTPIDMTVTTSLAVISTVLTGRVMVNPRGDWREHPNLYTTVIAQPSERKSAVFSYCTKPLHLQEDIEAKRAKDRRRECAQELARLKDDLKKTEKLKTPDRADKIRELSSRIEEMEQEIKPPVLVVDDATSEALENVMAANEGKMAYFSPEGAVFENVAASQAGTGRYGYKPEIFLKGFSGERVGSHRITRDAVYIRRALLTMGISVQPSVFENLRGSREIAGKGFFARFMYSIPESSIGNREVWPVEKSIEPVRIYNETILRMYRDLHDVSDHTVHLSPEAKEVFAEFWRRCEEELRPKGRLREIQSWGGRLHTLGLKLSLILYAAENSHKLRWWTLPIDRASMLRGCHIAWNYAMEHAREAYSMMGIKTYAPTEVAQAIITWIVESGGPDGYLPEFRKSEATKALQHRFKAHEISVALNDLIEYDYIQESDKRRRGRGRKATVYEVNPRITDGIDE